MFFLFWSQRDTNAQQTFSVVDIKREQDSLKRIADDRWATRNIEFTEMRKTVLTREVYEAYHKSDQERMDRIEKMLMQLIER